MRLLLLLLAAACASGPRALPAVEPADVLGRFAAAAEAGRWEEAWPLLSASWRERTTPARLADDWRAAGPVGREAAARVLALLRSGERPAVAGGRATLPVAPGRAARLVLEQGRWGVEALE